MEKRGLFLLAVILLLVGFFATNQNSVTGQQIAIGALEVDEQPNEFPRYIEVALGDQFLVPAGTAQGNEFVRFSGYDPFSPDVTFTNSRTGSKQFTLQTTSSFFGQKTTDLIYAGETIRIILNEGNLYPDGRPRIYLMSYANPKKQIKIGETMAFSELDICTPRGCPFGYNFHPSVWTLKKIDPSDRTIDVQDMFGTSAKSFTYEKTGHVDFINYGETYRAKVVKVGNKYELELTDSKFHIMDTTNVAIAYYK